MPPRITGTETEFGLLVQPEATDEFVEATQYSANLLEKYCPLRNHISTFYDNGCRFYRDYGEHFEYATPEDTSIVGTVANEIAGERIAYRTLDNARQDGRFYDFDLNKRVIGDNGLTWGHHENFLADPSRLQIDAASLALLGIHLATVSIFSGAGAVLSESGGRSVFVVAQKVMGLEEDFSSVTTAKKPLVNLRDEPLSNERRWKRVHVTSGDANMSPWAMRMRLGTISLVLHMIENGYKLGHLTPASALHQVSERVARDLTLKKTIRLANGKTIRPLEIQAAIAKEASKLPKHIDLTPEEEWHLSEWQRACDDASSQPESLADRVDWVAKALFLTRFKQRHNLSWESERLSDLDKLWGNLGPEGIGQKLRRGIWSQWMPDESLIKSREAGPPKTTRALVRASFIKHMSKNSSTTANWDRVGVNKKTITLSNPYATNNSRVSELLEAA